jgi:hypothetical protein
MSIQVLAIEIQKREASLVPYMREEQGKKGGQVAG